jgi:hypothetical protein
MNSLDTLDTLETSIIIQTELDKCNKKIKDYEIKNNIHTESLKVTYNYLNNLLSACENDEFDNDKKILMDDITILSKYLN